jgi:V8-like Glu-specific endopeptidase
VGEPLGNERSEITGGNLVPSSGHGAPDTSAIRIDLGSGNHCSGSKVGARVFWTAGHCMDGRSPNTQLPITNNLSGTFSGAQSYTVTLQTVEIHPSHINYVEGLFLNRSWNFGQYDVARFTVTADTPNIPPYTTTDSAWVNETQDVTFTGYGCDGNDDSHSGKKQYAFFTPVVDSAFAAHTGFSAQFSNDFFHHNIVSLGIPRGCPGDSGSPVWKKFGSVWKTVGIAVVGDAQFDYTGLARYSNVQNWLANPGFNQFTAGFQGFIFNRYTGRCLGVDVAGDSVISRRCDQRLQNADPQSWRLSGGGGGIFSLVNGKTGKCLDLMSPDSANSLLVQRTCLPTSDTSHRQHWLFPAVDPDSDQPVGTYRQIMNVRTNGCVFPNNPTLETSDGQQARTAPRSTLTPTAHYQAWMMTR